MMCDHMKRNQLIILITFLNEKILESSEVWNTTSIILIDIFICTILCIDWNIFIIQMIIMNTIFSRYRVIQLILCNRKWLKWLARYFGCRIYPMYKSWRIFSLLLRWFGHFAYTHYNAGDWALSKFWGLRLRHLLGLPGLFILKSYSEIRISCCIEISRFCCCVWSVQVFLGCWFDSVGGLIIGADWR